MKKYPPMQLSQIFKFGKYSGLTLIEAIANDPDYIKYMMENHDLEIDNESYTFLKDSNPDMDLL